jgi:hypothetical protein
VLIKVEDEDPSRLRIVEDLRPIGAIFVLAGIFLCGIAPSDPEMPVWFGLVFLLAGIASASYQMAEFNQDGKSVLLSSRKAFLWKSCKEIPFQSIQEVKIIPGSKGSRVVTLELLNRRQHRLAGFSAMEAERVRGLVCKALGQESSPSEGQDTPQEPSPLENLGKTEIRLGRAVKHNLMFSLLGGILLALLSPLLLPFSGQSFQPVSQLQQGDSRALLESSKVPLVIGGSWDPERQKLIAVSALGFADIANTMKDGEHSHFYMPLHYFAMLVFLFSGLLLGVYGLISKKQHLAQMGLSNFISCFVVFGVLWLVGMVGFVISVAL